MNAQTITIRAAERRRVRAKILIAGLTGGGKTYSAILLARGLVGPEGKVGFLDTESGRGSHYAGLAGGYDIGELAAPFTPQRYIEAIDQFEAAGYDALIIDSVSHEWEGEGGVLDQAETIELRTKKPGLHCWKDPKSQHKRFVNRLLRSKMHIIFCARAREKSVQVGREIVSGGLQPIVEKNFPFEVDVALLLDDVTKTPDLRKCPADLLPAFPKGMKISVESGRKIAAWLSGGVAVDHEHATAAEDGRDAARRGSSALRDWWTSLSKFQQVALTPMKDGELKSIALAVDQTEQMVRGAFQEMGDVDAPGEVAFDPLKDPRDTAKAADALEVALKEAADLDAVHLAWEDAAPLRKILQATMPRRLHALAQTYDERVEALS